MNVLEAIAAVKLNERKVCNLERYIEELRAKAAHKGVSYEERTGSKSVTNDSDRHILRIVEVEQEVTNLQELGHELKLFVEMALATLPEEEELTVRHKDINSKFWDELVKSHGRSRNHWKRQRLRAIEKLRKIEKELNGA